MRKHLSGEASQATYQAALVSGVSEDVAKEIARVVRKDLKARWTGEYLADVAVNGQLQHMVQERVHEARQIAKGIQVQQPAVMSRQDYELVILRRQRMDLLEALAEATGESLTTLNRLYGVDEPAAA